MSEFDYTTDLVVVGSGGGLCGAVAAADAGLDVLVVEKEPLLGGSTAMSGGVLWLPDNPLMRDEGVADSFDEAMAYFASVVGDVGPASSEARRSAYIDHGIGMVRFLQGLGMSFRRCEGYSDYYAGVRGVDGGSVRGRSVEPTHYDGKRLGPWLDKLRPGVAASVGVVVYTGEAATAQLIKRSPKALRTVARIAGRTIAGRLKGEARLSNGASLIAQVLEVAIAKEVGLWTEAGLVDLVLEEGRVVGVVVDRGGQEVRVRARHGVLLSSGGFARSPEMRQRYSKQPNDGSWSLASPGDTGEVIEIAVKHGAVVDLMDDAWWNPGAVLPDGSLAVLTGERSKPGSLIVDHSGSRYFNEAVAYVEAGQQMYARNQAGGSIPSWLIIDSRHRSRYMFAFRAPGRTPGEWLTSGFMKRADTLEDLARQCGIDPTGLQATVARFNGFATTGVDEDFHRGEGAHERYQGDITNKPNACLGPLDKPPFYAVEIVPGDVGTSGGILCDEHSRVLDGSGRPIAGLYAAGNCTASVMGRSYPGAGASIGASFVFSYIAAQHVVESAGGAESVAART